MSCNWYEGMSPEARRKFDDDLLREENLTVKFYLITVSILVVVLAGLIFYNHYYVRPFDQDRIDKVKPTTEKLRNAPH